MARIRYGDICRWAGLLITVSLVAAQAPFVNAFASQPADVDSQAREILKATGIQAGLIVHLGCGDGRLTAALHGNAHLVVQGLDQDSNNVETAKTFFHSLGLRGEVTAIQSVGGRLPYVDNLVNLVVVDKNDGVAMEEVMRVLCPGGVAYVRKSDGWQRVVKQRTDAIDEWTHFLHDATNNAVAQDTVSGPPNQLQWVGGPKWSRSHDHLASVSAVVSSGGRLFSIVDEGSIAAILLEPQWKLVARDAFNGVVLWKRDVPHWEWHLRGFRSGPSDLARRLVAVGNRVYTTLDVGGPLVALDAASGKTVRTYEQTQGTRDVLFDQGVLFVVAGAKDHLETDAQLEKQRRRGLATVRPQRPAYAESYPAKRLLAIRAEDGKLLWQKSDAATAELMPTAVAVNGSRVFFENPDQIVCLDRDSGASLWTSDRPTAPQRPTWSAPTLVAYQDVVLSADRSSAVQKKSTDEAPEDAEVQWTVSSAGGMAPPGQVIAFSAQDGRQLWSGPSQEGYNSPVDVLVAGGLVWTGRVVRAREPGITEGRDPRTGEVKRTRPNDQEFFAPGMGHGRCYRNKATSRYLVVGRSGVEFVDVLTGKVVPNHWTRGTCQYGVVPCNGLLYVPPHSCACFIKSKLNGYNCFSPKRASEVVSEPAADRWQRGPAFTEHAASSARGLPLAEDWPTYRHDAARSGYSAVALTADPKPAWEADLGGRLSSVVVADGRLLVAQVDKHTVHALNADNGKTLWTFTAAGRVDSPPTCWHGYALFGSADGWIYCLRASDGELAWRFRAAPRDQQIVVDGQLESAWPVPGSVLVHNNTAYAVAGRSSYLEGGIRLVRLDARTGKLLSETVVDDRDPQTGYQRKGSVRGTSMPGALPDVLSCDGQSIFMRHTRFDLDGKIAEPNVPHLYSEAGFLDDSWWHRTYWFVGSQMGTNYGGWPRPGNQVPAGRLLALDGQTVYGFGRNQYIHHGAHIGIDGATVFHFNPSRDSARRLTFYQAFAVDRAPQSAGKNAATKPGQKGKRKRAARPAAKHYRWAEKLPVLARALVAVQNHVLLAGPPDVLQSDDPVAAMAGDRGGLLCVLAKSNGETEKQLRLESPPVLDGLAVAQGRIYMATVHGKVVCLETH